MWKRLLDSFRELRFRISSMRSYNRGEYMSYEWRLKELGKYANTRIN